MPETILVLGSNSFTGSHFVNAALQRGFNVIGASRSNEPKPAFLPYKWNAESASQKFTFYQYDLNQDLAGLINLTQKYQPEYVVNFASQSMVAESWQYPEHWMMTNVVSTIKFHDHLRTCQFLKKYVHISTPEVYGTCEGLVGENQTYNPSTPYAVSRAACDMSLMTFFKNYNFPVVFTRAANVYGPGQQLYRIIPKTILSIKQGKQIPLHGGGHSVRSFIHAKDVVEGTLDIMLNAKPSDIYHLSTERNISIRNLVELICKKMDVQFDDYVKITEERPGKDAAYLLDSNKARQQLNWQDQVNLEEGIQETIGWVEKNLDELKQLSLLYTHKE